MKMWAGDFDPEYFDIKEATECMRNPIDLSDEYESDFSEDETASGNKKRWDDMPHDIQKMILDNAYCWKCKKTVTMVDYSLIIERGMEILKGKCSNCLNDVVRTLD